MAKVCFCVLCQIIYFIDVLPEYVSERAHSQYGRIHVSHDDKLRHPLDPTVFKFVYVLMIPILLKKDYADFNITEKDIADRSKGDIVSTGLVILQTTWFAIQCIARGVQYLPITELEFVILAFASPNLVTYTLWWNKPLNVQRVVPMVLIRTVDDDDKDVADWFTRQIEVDGQNDPINEHGVRGSDEHDGREIAGKMLETVQRLVTVIGNFTAGYQDNKVGLSSERESPHFLQVD